MTETIPGPDGAVPVDELFRATVVISGTKPSTCDACRSAIATRTPSFVAHGSGGRRWRLCRSCAPQTLGGFPLAWGRSCTWRARDTRTIEADESREHQDDDNSRPGGYEPPWAGSGWDKPPVTPEERGATETQEQEHRDAFTQQEDERRRKRELEVAEAAAVERGRSYDLIATLCEYASTYAGRADGYSREDFEAAAKLLAPDIVTSFDPNARIYGLSPRSACALLIHVCWESARQGFDTGHHACTRTHRSAG